MLIFVMGEYLYPFSFLNNAKVWKENNKTSHYITVIEKSTHWMLDTGCWMLDTGIARTLSLKL
jgi:hypothetical protein